MMLIVISNSRPLANEALLINRLFEAGMDLFHLRKPDASEKECKKLLDSIGSEHWNKIALHQQHVLAGDYGLVRLHIPALQRTAGNLLHLEKNKKDGMIYSTSIHSVKEYRNLPSFFSYTFLGPVFNSISKPGYKAKMHDISLLEDKRDIRLIGLCGVTAENCQQVFSMGFDGAAVSGTIWKSGQPIDEFSKIKKNVLYTPHSYKCCRF